RGLRGAAAAVALGRLRASHSLILAGAWYHRLAATLGTALGRNLLVPGPVLVEADRLLRSRIDGGVARAC
ncbi:MAG: hypothetical protein ACR2LH_04350, partial [Thermoleophilaceae bacterium]